MRVDLSLGDEEVLLRMGTIEKTEKIVR